MASLLEQAADDAAANGPGVKCTFHTWWSSLTDKLQAEVVEVIHAAHVPQASRVRVLQAAGCTLSTKQITRHMTRRDPCKRCGAFGLQVAE